MGRKRPEKDKWMPGRLYKGKSAYEYRPKSGTCIRVCSLDSPKNVVLRRFAEEYERYHTHADTVKALVDEFHKSTQWEKLSLTTRKDYDKYWKKIEPVFGHVNARKVRPEMIRQYMDVKGKSSEVQANRHLAFLSKLFSWGFERGKVLINPCKGVSRFKEVSRDRYIEDHEYDSVYECAPDSIKAAMEISYLCAARQGDVLKLQKSQLLDEGIFIQQGKTGKKQIKAWTQRLRDAVKMGQSIKTKIDTIYVIPTQSGTAYTSSGFRAMWRKTMEAARQKTGLPLDFTFHDLKAKGISDFDGDKQRFSGHKTAAQVATYDRKIEVVATLDLGKKRP